MANRRGICIVLALAVLLLVIFAPVLGKVGLSITPSSGEYSFKSGGGNLDMIITNYGDESSPFAVQLSGEGKSYALPSVTYLTIPPGQSDKITLTISSSSGAEIGKRYPLTVSVSAKSSSGSESSVSSQMNFVFLEAAGESNYVISGSLNPPESLVSSKLFTFFAALLLVGLAYYLIKTKGPWKG